MLKSILRHEWIFWIVVCTLSVFLSPKSSPILFLIFALALPFFAIMRWQVRLPTLPPLKILVPTIGLLLSIALSAVITPDFAFSLRKISGLINGIGLFIALNVSENKNIPNWLLLLFGIIIAAVGAIGSDIYARIPLLFPIFRLFYLIVPFLPNVQRVVNANLIAGALLWTLPVSIGICIFYWRKSFAWLAGVSAVAAFIQIVMLLIMQSRAALLAIIITGLWAIWVSFVQLRRAIRNGMIILIVIVTLLISPIWPNAISTALQEAYFSLLVKGDEGEQGLNSIDGRVKIWNRSIEKIGARPITGHGLNIFRTIANTPTPIFELESEKEIPHAHNWALQIILELGTLGILFYGWLMAGAIWNLKARWQSDLDHRPITVGYTAALLAFMLFGLLDTISPGARPDFIFWILLAGSFNPIALNPTQPEQAAANP